MTSERLKQLRKAKQVSQDAVSKEIGITKSAYSYYETGRNTPSVEVLIKMAHYYGVTTDYLLGQSEKPDGRGNYRQAALSKLGDVSKLSEDDLDEINAIIELKMRRKKKQS